MADSDVGCGCTALAADNRIFWPQSNLAEYTISTPPPSQHWPEQYTVPGTYDRNVCAAAHLPPGLPRQGLRVPAAGAALARPPCSTVLCCSTGRLGKRTWWCPPSVSAPPRWAESSGRRRTKPRPSWWGRQSGRSAVMYCRAVPLHALLQGINYIDTAPWYGHGRSEEVLGQALKSIPRQAYYIATKVG